MWLDVVIVALGFAGLIWGADKFVAGASAIALNWGVTPLMIGLTIVAFGTSAPEFFSSAVAAVENQAAIAIGNALGSNIFNIGVALGVAALIRPIIPPASVRRRELPILLLVSVVTGFLFANLTLGPYDSVILIALLVFVAVRLSRPQEKPVGAEDLPADDDVDIAPMSTSRASLFLMIGLALLILGAEALVGGASAIATELGVSSAVIGLTIVAFGTSLPELAACVASVLKGQSDLAIGNIVGSNILNLLVVLPFPGLLAAGLIEPDLLYRDYLSMLLMTLVLAAVIFWTIKSGKHMGRGIGAVFLLMYAAWFSTLLQQA
ncbi:MAG: calcium/sodium antiporter [Pseudomonadales bacterium]|nr:calcium/sodium antiporter [Pseudomonadales bacterium]